ncbi:glycosyltransferase family 25 protein [Pseudooceanicola spongiae]|uniref:Glycosyl transferase family 25 domain-containing protein n=1 Tax=Pseudooceanicola spongiae TaxID=2613965 RepID=A0A7L9WM47_9RHOB|nr:glycosyltransferase family 25 protein [Pseudooceanicola spongiae]QOL81465.1 hypothetical protein F3W81_11905 [Pseudooceanicola spongiae]
MQIPIYIVNLDRRQDRLEALGGQLDQMGLTWNRVSAVDGHAAPAGRVHPRIADSNHIIPMGRGSQARATTLLNLCETILSQPGKPTDGVVMLEDDAYLAQDFAAFCRDDSWIPDDFGLVQLEKRVEGKPKKLLGAPVATLPGAATPRQLRRLYLRTGGSAAFYIRRSAMQKIVEGGFEIRFPTDHLLFSPNVSPVFAKIGVGMMTPGLAVQNLALDSDMSRDRGKHRTLKAELRRAVTEVNCLPRQLALLATGRAKLIDPEFAE